MKYRVAGFLVVLIMAQCSMQRSIDKDIEMLSKKVPDSFPPGNSAVLKATAHRGYALYKAACAGSGCHGVTDRGTDTIPYFTFVQLDNYDKAAQKHDPKNHAVTAKLSPDQLKDILSFLFLRTLARQVEAKQPETGSGEQK